MGFAGFCGRFGSGCGGGGGDGGGYYRRDSPTRPERFFVVLGCECGL